MSGSRLCSTTKHLGQGFRGLKLIGEKSRETFVALNKVKPAAVTFNTVCTIHCNSICNLTDFSEILSAFVWCYAYMYVYIIVLFL